MVAVLIVTSPELPARTDSLSELEIVCPLTTDVVITISVDPVFWKYTAIPESVKSTVVILNSSVSMKVKVIEPIHAATAIDTATVTAMSMIAATTGLRAFLFF